MTLYNCACRSFVRTELELVVKSFGAQSHLEYWEQGNCLVTYGKTTLWCRLEIQKLEYYRDHL